MNIKSDAFDVAIDRLLLMFKFFNIPFFGVFLVGLVALVFMQLLVLAEFLMFKSCIPGLQ